MPARTLEKRPQGELHSKQLFLSGLVMQEPLAVAFGVFLGCIWVFSWLN
jgi:hypothetical protein